MIVEAKDCRTCIWYKANMIIGKDGCVLKRATLHQLYARQSRITCFDYELYNR